MFLRELEAMRFTSDQARLAELWILHGDWRYRTKEQYRLMLSDFFPPIETIQYLLDQNLYRVVTLKELIMTRKEYYERGKAAAAAEARSTLLTAADESERRATAEVVYDFTRRIELEEECEHLTRLVRMLESDKVRLERQVASLRADTNNDYQHSTSEA